MICTNIIHARIIVVCFFFRYILVIITSHCHIYLKNMILCCHIWNYTFYAFKALQFRVYKKRKHTQLSQILNRGKQCRPIKTFLNAIKRDVPVIPIIVETIRRINCQKSMLTSTYYSRNASCYQNNSFYLHVID
jgi:hypothetical protein